jgi:hypothetical protein
MPRPKPIATQLTCAAALAVFLFGSTDHLGPKSFAALLLICALLPAAGVCLDWIRLERPRFDDAFFAAATIAGAAVVGLAPSGVTALWHPVLLVVALTFALRRTVVAGAIVDRDATHLTLALERGRLRVDRDAHEALGGRSPLVLDEGAPLALTTRIGEEQRGEGPFRSARILSHGPIIAVGATPGELRRRRRSHLLVAVGMVLASAAIGWGVALVHLPMIGAPVGCPHSF